MNNPINKFDQLVDSFPALQGLEDAPKKIIDDNIQFMKEKAGTVLFAEGTPCRGYVLLLKGSVKVLKTAENGREIILYRVEEGESCIMTTSCLISSHEYNAEGIAETDIELAVFPPHTFNELLGCSAIFRKFTFEVYAERMAMLMMLIEEVVFKKLDERLAKLLSEKSQTKEIIATHQELATELGSVREVVSRQMKSFERAGLIELNRGKIKIIDIEALKKYKN